MIIQIRSIILLIAINSYVAMAGTVVETNNFIFTKSVTVTNVSHNTVIGNDGKTTIDGNEVITSLTISDFMNQTYKYPSFCLRLGGLWTDFEIKASTNNFTTLVYWYASSSVVGFGVDDNYPFTYFVDDYAYDVRKWVSTAPHTPILSYMVNTNTEVETVYFFPSRNCQYSANLWMWQNNSNLVWSYIRYGPVGYEKNVTGTKSHWNPIRPDSWERVRTVP